jgi:hypothetical protein
MNYKLERTLIKNKKTFIVAGILWLFFTIVLVLPIAHAMGTVKEADNGTIDVFFSSMTDYFMAPMDNIAKLGSYWGSFIKIFPWYTVLFAIVLVIGVMKKAPKSEYEDIEHGSSDWCEKGEQYKVLSKKKGLILGEKNYLPVDKRGNVNILVVGRIWCW